MGALFLEHREVMYSVAYSLLRTDRHNRAEDVIGEVMISIVKNPPRQEVRSWEAFLVRAVQNKVRDLWKSAAHRHERLVIDEASPLEDERHGGDQVDDDPAPGVVEMIGRQQRVQAVQEAMAELEAWDRQAAYALWQCAGLERSSQEVANELGVSSSRVRQLSAKARKELINILGAKEVDL
ncbi:RNA polymerase sigma factor (plasmid) [Nocardioides sp. QY071]|uniref:RNA polymerase sigma factor n=1 Tax=Nocardioides sp. QY071 TaxID=3044187 RepID=UPI00249A2C16|nr:RNA polymerase sigma factor [Nocardioides sp. QY071]WGY04955.1 RNA polymerase sigma factor [Nocardioides sp. QY071]